MAAGGLGKSVSHHTSDSFSQDEWQDRLLVPGFNCASWKHGRTPAISSRDLAVYAVQQVQLPKGEEAWHVIIRMKLSLEYTEQIRACQYRQHQVGGATKR